MKSLLKPGGVLVLAGYKKQHFDEREQPELFSIFNNTIQSLLPFFECDVGNNDNAYCKSHPCIKRVFNESIFEIKLFKEEAKVPLSQLFDIIQSWSAYTNFRKCEKVSKIKDPLETLKDSLMSFYKSEEEEFTQIENSKLLQFLFYFNNFKLILNYSSSNN